MACSPSGSSVREILQQEPWSGFPFQEPWSGFPFPSPGHLLDLGIKPTSPASQVGSLPLSHRGRSFTYMLISKMGLQKVPGFTAVKW